MKFESNNLSTVNHADEDSLIPLQGASVRYRIAMEPKQIHKY
jgi:hypothetical protein